MNANTLRNICLQLPGATEQIQWGDDRVFKVAGKMFACSGTSADSGYSFKCDPERFLELTDLPGVRPAPYLARAGWIRIDPDGCELPDRDVRALVRRSYELVVAKLPQKTRAALGV